MENLDMTMSLGQDDQLYYRHNGTFTPMGLVVTIFVGVAAGLVLGGAYGAICYVNPFIYVSVLATLGSALATAFVVLVVAKWMHIRSTPLVLVAGLVSAMALVYGNWAMWAVAITEWDFTYLTMTPMELWQGMGEVAEQGYWSIGSGDTPVSGLALWGVWLVEAGILVCFLLYMLRGWYAKEVYCETCQQWATDSTYSRYGVPESFQTFLSQLTSGNADVLADLHQVPDRVGHPYLQFGVHTCGGSCKEVLVITQSVDVFDEKKKKKKNADPELKTKSTEVLRGLYVPFGTGELLESRPFAPDADEGESASEAGALDTLAGEPVAEADALAALADE